MAALPPLETAADSARHEAASAATSAVRGATFRIIGQFGPSRRVPADAQTVTGLATVSAEPAEHDVVSCDPVADFAGHAVHRALESLVLPGLHLAAVLADHVVMMVAARKCRLVARRLIADVDALDETELGEQIEHPVNTRDSDGPARAACALVDLLGCGAALLPAEQLDHRCARSSATEPRVAEDA